MADTQQHKRFLSVLATTFLSACLTALAFNYLVDPYGLFGSRRITGLNALKPAAAEKVRVAKPYMASRAKPKVVIGGNSRPEMGLNPQSGCWDDADQPVFNTAIPGADVFMQVRYVQHAAESGAARRIVFGIDFLDFLVDASQPTGRIDWNTLGRHFDGRLTSATQPGFNPPISPQQAEDIFTGLFSLAAVGDSLLTVASQHDIHSATRQENGFNPAQDYLPIIRSEGQSVLFMQKNAELRKRLQPTNLGVLDASGQPAKPFLALRRMLEWARSRGIEVTLFINPYHSDYLVQIEASGKWPLLEEWKRQLAGVAAEYAVPLWDFNTLDRYSTEAPPARNDRRTILHWFWEPAHYRQELGDMMLASMLARPCSAPSSRFGVRVTQASLAPHLDKLRTDLSRFIQQHPDRVYRLAAGDSR
jgi:hypothetical protein